MPLWLFSMGLLGFAPLACGGENSSQLDPEGLTIPGGVLSSGGRGGLGTAGGASGGPSVVVGGAGGNGGAAFTRPATPPVDGSGGSPSECTNVRPTGTDWDQASCDQWASQTGECQSDWMIDKGYCNESCGRCTSSMSTGGTASQSGGSPASGGSPTSGGSPASDGSPAPGGTGGQGGGARVPKFVGNVTTRNKVDAAGLAFSKFWDQITPENAGKWGSVQRTPESNFEWGTLDAIYDYAQDNGIIFKQHTFVWGNQQPNGVPSKAQVINWIKSFCERYPKTALIDVVNEPPPHTSPNYAQNIGGGTDGDWAWITNSFKWAREYCPNSVLIFNDYNNIEWPAESEHFIEIVKTVLANGGPIDAVGAQSHDLDHPSVSAERVSELLQALHVETGLPVYITELDLSYSDEQKQLNAYKEFFPMFLDANFVPGITVWGWIYGSTWDQAPDSGLVTSGGKPRAAMTWLMNELKRPSP